MGCLSISPFHGGVTEGVTQRVISVGMHPQTSIPLGDCPLPSMSRHFVLSFVLVSGLALGSPPILSKTLPDGLEVVVVEVPSSPLVTVEVAVRNGSMTEPPDFN